MGGKGAGLAAVQAYKSWSIFNLRAPALAVHLLSFISEEFSRQFMMSSLSSTLRIVAMIFALFFACSLVSRVTAAPVNEIQGKDFPYILCTFLFSLVSVPG
jgi:hypothetical protein